MVRRGFVDPNLRTQIRRGEVADPEELSDEECDRLREELGRVMISIAIGRREKAALRASAKARRSTIQTIVYSWIRPRLQELVAAFPAGRRDPPLSPTATG